MSYFNKFFFLVIFVTVTACKTSPEPNDSVEIDLSTTATPTANSEEPDLPQTSAQGPVAQEPVVSTASSSSSGVSSDEYDVKAGEFNLYPRETSGWDSSGWSIITPSQDSRLIYVSSSLGDDSTAEYYSPDDVSDIYVPGGIKPFKTVHAALASMREGYPDWMLLLRGDTWELSSRVELKGGRSITERSVITAYGTSNERPTLKSNESELLRIWPDINYVAITDLSLKAFKRNPHSVDFAGWGSVTQVLGLRMYSPKGTVMGSILVGGNEFDYFSKGITVHGGGEFHDIVVRRNIVRNSYSERAHSQGMYASHASVLLEENIFDHNGWYKKQLGSGNEEDEGQATMFNHNTYFSEAFHTKFIRNIFLRSSSMQNKWAANSAKDGTIDSVESHDLLVQDNLYVGGEIGISAGGNTDYDTGPRWENVDLIDNVLLAIGRDQPTNRTLGWYIEASDWKGGSICGNYLLNNDNALVTNLEGINLSGHSSDVTISDNTIHGLLKGSSGVNSGAITIDAQVKSNITVDGNNIQLAGSKMRVLVAQDISSVVFESNSYFSGADADVWFRESESDREFESWKEETGDINSLVKQDSFSEPRRSFETYLSLIGASGSIDTFVELVVSQSKDDWSRDLTASAISDYIRDGYGGLRCTQ